MADGDRLTLNLSSGGDVVIKLRPDLAPGHVARITELANSGNSQFFICFDDATFLDRQYTVWGQVESGMEHVDALPVGEPPREPGKIVKASVGTAG